jgi:small subunit ribosomal protein S8e
MQKQFRGLRKPTGGLYHKLRKTKKRDLGRDFRPVHLSPQKAKNMKTLGGGQKTILLAADIAHVLDPATHTVKKAKIITVKGNPANPHFVRMNVLTKGAIVETELGLAKVTSRPGQHGTINAVLVQKKA